MSDLTQADIDDAVADYQQRIADLVAFSAHPGELVDLTSTNRVEVCGEPDVTVNPSSGSLTLSWDGQAQIVVLADSVVRAVAAAILATAP